MRRLKKGPIRPNLGRPMLNDLMKTKGTIIDYSKVTPTRLPAVKPRPKKK